MGTEQTRLKPGGNVDSWCGKCKMILAHTIEAMVGEKPARVHCNTCKSQHGYKPNPPAKSSRQPREPGSAPTAGAPKQRANRYQSLLKAKTAEAVKPYSFQATYEAGDVLDHPTFGRGIATAVNGTKVEVLFEGGPKTLIHGR